MFFYVKADFTCPFVSPVYNNTVMQVITIRILAAFAAGFLLGLERQFHRQPAGLKTVILICVGSSLLMIVSLMMAGAFPEMILGMFSRSNPANDFYTGDPGRIAAQVVSGIGFLGAGAIIRQGLNIKGLTTAATIWLAAAIGLSCGAGEYFPAFVTLAVALCTLIVMEKIEEKVFPAKKIKTLCVICSKTDFNLEEIQNILQENKIIVNNIDMTRSKSSGRVKVFFQIHTPESLDTEAFCGELEKNPSVLKIEITSNEKAH